MFYLVKQSIKFRAFRTVVTVTCISILIATLFIGTLVLNGVNRSIDLTQMRLGADLMVVPKGAQAEYEKSILTGKFYSEQTLLTGIPFGFYMDGMVADIIRKIPGVEQSTVQVYTATLPGSTCPKCQMSNLFCVAFNPETDFTIIPWLKTKINQTLGLKDVIVGRNVIGTWSEEAALGVTLHIFGYEFKIRGVLKPTGTGVDHTIFITLEGFRDMILKAPYLHGTELHKLPEIEPTDISAVLINLDPKASYEIVASDIYAKTRTEGINVEVSQATELGQEVRQKMNNVLAGVSMAAGLLWGLSILFISSIFLLSVNERRREIGLLRSMGGTRNFIFGLIMSEAILLTLLGGVVGVAAGFLVLRFLGKLIIAILGVPYIWPSLIKILILVGLSLGLATSTGIVAAFYPSARAARMEPYESVRKGW